MLDLRRLRVLLTIRERGSISAAAESLSVTQPAVSRQVVRLEAEVGAELIRRTTSGVELTPAGALLAQHAETILVSVSRAEQELRDLTHPEEESVRVGFFPTSATIVHNTIRQMRELMPWIEIQAIEGEPDEVFAQLALGELDVGLVCTVDPPEVVRDDGLIHTFLFDDMIYVALPAGHPCAVATDDLDIRDLAHEPWGYAMAHDHPCSVILRRAFAAFGGEPRLTFRANDYMVVQELVAAGVGLGLVPDLAINGNRSDIVFRPLRGAHRRVEVVVPPRIHRAGSIVSLVDILVGLRGGPKANDRPLAADPT